MKQVQFQAETTEWLDKFITKHGRGPDSYAEFIQFTMDSMVDMEII